MSPSSPKKTSKPHPAAPSPAHAGAPPLSRLLLQTADAVQAVRDGKSLTEVLGRCPADLRPATQALSFHVLRHLGSAQAVRVLLAPKAPPPKIDALLLCALALLWPVPAPLYADHTVVDQAVAATRKRLAASAGFVNAVLRRFLRERSALVSQCEAQPEARWNHPAWWVSQVQADWPAHWQAVLQASQTHPPMTLRVHARHGSAAAYLQRLQEAGLAGRLLGDRFPQAVVLDKPVAVTQLPGFAQGEVSVQDAAAQLAAPLLVSAWPELGLPALPAGARVLDACAAPGGKTAHLLELADLALTALDADAQRLTRVQQNLDRLGQRARLQAADAADLSAWWDGQPLDAILLDAPCSASGIVRRHPDVRWLRRASDIAQLAQQQSRLLEALWPTLKPGGRLVYATCSLFKAEGEAQVDAFLQRHADARLQKLPGLSGHLLPLADNGALAPDGVPEVAAVDGFFYALMLKS